MASPPRKKADSQIYHVVTRGNNQQNIFLDDEDLERYRRLLSRLCADGSIVLYAYCLMTNHTHLLVKEGKSDLSAAMRRLNSAYAMYMNHKYEASGHVFQGRFFSSPVDDDRYFLAALRYIHRNPQKAGLIDDLSYIWSSYDEYLEQTGIVETDFALQILGGVNEFIKLHQQDERELVPIYEPGQKMTKVDALNTLLFLAGVNDADELRELNDRKLAKVLKDTRARNIPILWLQEMTGHGYTKLRALLNS